jgi:oligopeptidase B
LNTSAPRAEKRQYSYTHHGETISDPYHWLRDPGYPDVTDPDVLAHLGRENQWFEAAMAPHKPLIDNLFAEMRGRIKEDDATVPQRDGDWLYWSEFEVGSEYRKHYRKAVAGGEPQLILDVPALAAGLDYFSLNSVSVSENGRFIAYASDSDGSERFTVHIVDLTTGEKLPDTIPETNSDLVWAAGDTMLIYGHVNANWRVESVRAHRLGTDHAADVELYHEGQLGFSASPGMSANRQWLIIASGDNETSEVRLLPAADPLAAPLLVKARQTGVEYGVDLHGRYAVRVEQ